MGARQYYLLTRLPPLPALGDPPPITLAEALELLRREGAPELLALAGALDAERALRAALDEWVCNLPGSRVIPADLPPALQRLFEEERVAETSEAAWIGAVAEAWLGLIAATGRDIGSPLLEAWAAWEGGLRRRLAGLRGDTPAAAGEAPAAAGADWETPLAAWAAERAAPGAGPLDAAMRAEQALDRARLAHLAALAPQYSFTLDELAAYLLALRIHERHRVLDPARGRELLRQVASL